MYHNINIFSQITSTSKGNSIVLMLSSTSNINRHQLLCDAHSVSEQHKGIVALFLYYSLSSFSAFFCVFVTLDSPISFLGCL